MGSYVKKTLSPGEEVIMEAQFHWIRFFWPVLFIIISLYYMSTIHAEDAFGSWMLFGFFLLILYLSYRIISLLFDEVTLTNQRLVAKRGILSRQTLDLQLSEVESIGADLPFLTHFLFKSGTILIRGTGASYLPVPGISNVLEFRKVIQETLNKKQANSNIIHKEQAEKEPQEINKSADKIELLAKLKTLLDEGVISLEEFKEEKNRIMNGN